MNSYYIFWSMLIAASLWISLGGFLWAHRRGQFKDQERARFLPLRGEAHPAAPEKTRGGVVVSVALQSVAWLAGLLVVLVMVIIRATGGRL